MNTGKTITSGFGIEPLAALRIIWRACFKLSVLLAVTPPSCINAMLNALKVGAAGDCAIDMNERDRDMGQKSIIVIESQRQ